MLMIVAMSVSMFTACGDKEEEKDKYSYEEISELSTSEINDMVITFDDLEEGVAEKIHEEHPRKYKIIKDNGNKKGK